MAVVNALADYNTATITAVSFIVQDPGRGWVVVVQVLNKN